MKSLVMAARNSTTALLMAGTLLTLAAPALADAPAASVWSRLWRTPDQRGQALLLQGNAAAAAQTFADPQRKAHAELQAHDYAAAAQTLTGIDVADAQYNRGNALAHTGDLPGALQAYDAALKQNPQHTDARHNRDIVAAALQKQKEAKKDQSKQDKQQSDKQDAKAGDEAKGKQDSKESKPDAKPGDKSDSKQDGKEGKPDAKPGEKSDGKQDGKDGKFGAKPDGKAESKQAGKAGQPDATPSDGKGGQTGEKANDMSGSKPEEKPGQKPSVQPNASPPAKPNGEPVANSQPATKRAAGAAGANNLKDDAAQARRDAESVLGKGTQPPNPKNNGAPAATPGTGGASDAARLPLTEKQIAQEQWLRAIPDDPGGLLRRKFLIEHMRRQQGQKP